MTVKGRSSSDNNKTCEAKIRRLSEINPADLIVFFNTRPAKARDKLLSNLDFCGGNKIQVCFVIDFFFWILNNFFF